MAGLMSCVKRACSVGHPLISQNWCCWLVGYGKMLIGTWKINIVINHVHPISFGSSDKHIVSSVIAYR